MIEGVYVAAVTPFRDDFSIDVDAYRAHVEWLAERGVTGIVAFGTNGEGPSVSAAEKLEVLRALTDVQVIPTVAEANLPATLELIEALNDFDVPGVMVLPPYFFKPASADGLRAFFEPAVAASRLPVVLYHIPRFSVPVPVEVAEALPVWGVKDSGEETDYTPAIVAAGREVLVGTEDDLATRLGRGASGVVSGLANAAPELVVGIWEAFKSGDAEAAGEGSARLREIRDAAPGFAARKRLAALRSGNDLGTVRPPLEPITDDGALPQLADQIEGVRA